MVAKSTVFIGVCVLYMAVLISSTSARSKRSVNFTPSWGKRSSGFSELGLSRGGLGLGISMEEKCTGKELYIETLIDTLKVNIAFHSACRV